MDTLIIQIILLFISLIIFINVIVVAIASKKEKRIGDFSLSEYDTNKTNASEKFNNIFWKIIQTFSNLFRKSKFLSKRAENYEKYILISEEKYKTAIDYITIKIIIILFMIILYFILFSNNILPCDLIICLLLIILAYVFPDFIWQMLYTKKCENISSRLYESIIIIDNSISKTNIYNAIYKVIDEIQGDLADEYQKVLVDLSYNLTLSQAFKRFYERTRIPEIRIIYHLLDAEQDDLEQTFHLIREQFEYIDKQNANKSSINSIINIMVGVYLIFPLLLIVTVLIINVDYFKNIIDNPFGLFVMEIITAIYIAFIFVIRKVTEVQR